jgi:DNA primase
VDRHQHLRELPFPVLAAALGLDMSKFKPRKGGTEFSGPCPVHRPKRNSTSFSYSQNGAFNCFSCQAKGRGAIDLLMAVKGIGFQEAVSALESAAGSAPQSPRLQPPSPAKPAAQSTSENPPFRGSYEKFFKPHPWLAERGLSQEALDRYGVGYYQNDSRRSAYNSSVLLRVSRYSDGETVGYLSRNIGDPTPEKPKYRFPDGLHKGLEMFGAWQLKEDHKLPVRVCYLASPRSRS